MNSQKTKVTVEATVNVPADKAWKLWNGPEHIVKWCSGHPDWHTPKATNDLKVGGRFTSRMESKDGKMGFDFGGKYDAVRTNEYIEYTMDDGRKVWITFTAKGNATHISETFEAETQNPVEMQKEGWQNIMNNFKNYAEAN